MAARGLLKVHPSIASALAAGKPVVALESTIITHGLPYPANLHTALAIEQAVRDQGAVPATTAFLDGLAYVGLENKQVERLAEVGLKATKTSRRDVTFVLAAGRGSVGATTVSGTMILAHMAGISIFGTGGIGGVHRGGQDSMDVSADLTELSRTPVAVFCSGAKSILDIPRTLEYLETFGVSTHTFNASGQFPAFYSAHSGSEVPSVSTYKEAAEIIHSNMQFGLQSGMVFGVPIPSEFEAAGEKIQAIVEQAVKDSVEQGIDRRGKEVTPWLLKRVSELSEGRSITSNKALVINNVSTAAKVACELELLKIADAAKKAEKGSKLYNGTGYGGVKQAESGNTPPPLFVVGFTAVDITSQRTGHAPRGESQPNVASTWPGRNTLSLGGVARNVAESAHRILNNRSRVLLISPIGNDALGHYIKAGLTDLGLQTSGLLDASERTASVTLQLDGNGDLITGIADIEERQLEPAHVDKPMSKYRGQRKVVAFDGNISVQLMDYLVEDGSNVTIFEPTSVEKCTKILSAAKTPDVITPNEAEVVELYSAALAMGLLEEQRLTAHDESVASTLNTTATVVQASSKISLLLKTILLVKSGARGVLLVCPDRCEDGTGPAVTIQRFAALPVDFTEAGNTTGCGDTFAGAIAASAHALLHRTHRRPKDWSTSTWSGILTFAQKAAGLTLRSQHATSPELSALGVQIGALINNEQAK
ncbi:hypothetical protein CBS101457_005318 [Exobasidium rhododendri]|nr:hypothetical protein CBS101457_005318 [Exobasidium rhododendri]